jgi:hypothetical protein
LKLSIRARRYLRRAGYVATLLVLYCLAHLLLVAFPRPLFAYEYNHGNFTVYMREPVPAEIAGVLDRVHALLAASPLNDESLHHDIYIVNSFRLSRYLLLGDVGFGANHILGHTFIVSADPVRDLAFCERHGPDDHRVRHLSETIAHEIAHSLIRRHVGWRAEARMPSWLKEGYCEVVADSSPIDERRGLTAVKNDSPSFPGLPYFRYRLAVAYLLKDRCLSIDQLFDNPPDFRRVEADVRTRLCEDEAGFIAKMGSHIGSAAQGPSTTERPAIGSQ